MESKLEFNIGNVEEFNSTMNICNTGNTNMIPFENGKVREVREKFEALHKKNSQRKTYELIKKDKQMNTQLFCPSPSNEKLSANVKNSLIHITKHLGSDGDLEALKATASKYSYVLRELNKKFESKNSEYDEKEITKESPSQSVMGQVIPKTNDE